MWCVKMTAPREVHVYPLLDNGVHILNAELCNCMPEVRYTGAGRMVVHKKMGHMQTPMKPILKVHWIQ